MGPTGCSEPGCDHQHYARKLCNRRTNSFALTAPSTSIRAPRLPPACRSISGCATSVGTSAQRLLDLARDHESSGLRAVGCWAEGRQSLPAAYGQPAAYTARVGPIPDDAVIVPKCGEPSCIRPDTCGRRTRPGFIATTRPRECSPAGYVRKARRYRLSPDNMRVIDGLARAARLTANVPSTPAAVPLRSVTAGAAEVKTRRPRR